MSIHALEETKARLQAAGEDEKLQVVASTMTFLSPLLGEYLRCNPDLPQISPRLLISELRAHGRDGCEASSAYLSMFEDLIGHEGDDRDGVWLDVEVLVMFRHGAKLAQGDRSKLDQAVAYALSTLTDVFDELLYQDEVALRVGSVSMGLQFITEHSQTEVEDLAAACATYMVNT